jgi:Ca2+-transporting ATPase
MHVVAAFEWRDPLRSVFNGDTLANGRFVLVVVASIGLTFLASTLGGLQRILDTVALDGVQWRACLIAVVGYLMLSEIGKLVLRRVGREHAT